MDRAVRGSHSEEVTFKLRAEKKPEEMGRWHSVHRDRKL